MSLRIRSNASQRRRAGAYVGYVGYAKILAATAEPRTHAEISAITGVYEKGLLRLLKQFRAFGLVHRVGWVKPDHGFAMAQWKLGMGEEAPVPLNAKGRPQAYHDQRPKMQPRAVAFASLVNALQQGASSRTSLMEQSGLPHGALHRVIAAMHKMKLITVAAWTRREDGCGPWIPCYEWGPGVPNIPRPKARKRKDYRKMRREMALPAWARTVVGLKRQAGFQAAKA